MEKKTAAAPKAADDEVEVRILLDHLDYLANQVVSLPKAEAAAAVDAGWADADPAAVEYAKSIARD